MKQKYLRSVPPGLKEKLIARSQNLDQSLNDTIVGILCDHFSIEYEGSGLRFNGLADRNAPNVIVRMPGELRKAIEEEAHRQGLADSDLMKKILARRFRIPFQPTARWAVPA